MGGLTIAVTEGACGPVLVLSGEADMTTAPELSAALAVQVGAAVRHLAVDLSGLLIAPSVSNARKAAWAPSPRA